MPTNINNEEELKQLIADRVGGDPNDMDVKELRGRWLGYDNVNAKLVEFSGDEIIVFQNQGDAEKAAHDYIVGELANDPKISEYGEEFIERHLNKPRLKNWVQDDVLNYSTYVRDIDPEEFWDLARVLEVTFPEGNEGTPTFEQRDVVRRAYAEDAAEDPIHYLREQGFDKPLEEAITRLAGFHIESAARELLRTRGVGGTLGMYDGRLYSLPDGLVFVFHDRTNLPISNEEAKEDEEIPPSPDMLLI